MSRPDHIKCIADTTSGKLKADPSDNPDPKRFEVKFDCTESLCGRYTGMEWCFTNISHAYNSIDQGERFRVCPDFWKEAKNVIEDGIADKSEESNHE